MLLHRSDCLELSKATNRRIGCSCARVRQIKKILEMVGGRANLSEGSINNKAETNNGLNKLQNHLLVVKVNYSF